jgi:hypothetical protein
MAVGLEIEYELCMNAFIASTSLAVPPELTEMETFQGLPPDPKDPVKSSKKSSHELIIDGADTTTAGCTGATGARTDTVCIVDLPQVMQYSTDAEAVHLAPRTLALSLTSELGTRADDASSIMYIILSLVHWQVDFPTPSNSMIEVQEN